MMNPAGRRVAEREFRILMGDLRSGRLKTAMDELARLFAAPGANYTKCEVPLLPLKLSSLLVPQPLPLLL